MMTFIERKNFCEKLIEPHKEKLSDEALEEIYRFCEDYDLGIEPNAVYTEEELSEIKNTQRIELWCMTIDVLIKNDLDLSFTIEDDDK